MQKIVKVILIPINKKLITLFQKLQIIIKFKQIFIFYFLMQKYMKYLFNT
jgi:hypothetical protein